MLKTILFRIYGTNLADNYHSAVNDYLTIEDKKQRAIMKRHAYLGRILFCFMMGTSYCASTSIGLIPVLAGDEHEHINITNEDSVREYPIPSRCTFEYFNPSDNAYKFICIFEALTIIFTSNSYIGNLYSLFKDTV